MMPANGCLAIPCLRLCNECNKIAINAHGSVPDRTVGPASVAPPGINWFVIEGNRYF